MPLTTTEPVCWPDAQRIAASRPFHGTGGDALLALGLPSRVHLVMHEEHHHLSRGLGAWGGLLVELEYPVGAATAFPSASGRDTSPNAGLQRPPYRVCPRPR